MSLIFFTVLGGTLAEVFYFINYGFVNNYAKCSSNNFSNENINIGVSREMIYTSKIVHFGILVHVLS